MSEENQVLEFIAQRKTPTGDWVVINEFVIRVPPEELAIIYSAHIIRKSRLVEAEANLTNYIHKEPMKMGGKIRTVEIHSAGKTMKVPFLIGCKAEPGCQEALDELKTAIPKNAEWRMEKEVGLQAIASIGWLADVTKARPPDITKDTSSVDYEQNLLPGNLQIAEDSAPSGYNKSQVELLEEAQKTAAEALIKSGNLHGTITNMSVVTFGELIFKTWSRLFGSLPDPEAKQREEFEALRKEAAEKAAEAE